MSDSGLALVAVGTIFNCMLTMLVALKVFLPVRTPRKPYADVLKMIEDEQGPWFVEHLCARELGKMFAERTNERNNSDSSDDETPDTYSDDSLSETQSNPGDETHSDDPGDEPYSDNPNDADSDNDLPDASDSESQDEGDTSSEGSTSSSDDDTSEPADPAADQKDLHGAAGTIPAKKSTPMKAAVQAKIVARRQSAATWRSALSCAEKIRGTEGITVAEWSSLNSVMPSLKVFNRTIVQSWESRETFHHWREQMKLSPQPQWAQFCAHIRGAATGLRQTKRQG